MACYASFTTFGFLGSVSLLILIPVFLFDKHLDTKFGNLATAT
jgi:hypothetical protein